MIYLIASLIIIGVVLLIIEAFVPGFGVFGVSGIICIAVADVFIALTVSYGWLIVIAELATILIIISFVFKYMKNNRMLYGKIILEDVSECAVSNNNYGVYIGDEGITRTPLRPFGNADFSGLTVEVYSDGEYIYANERIKVINICENKIFVKRIESN